MEFEARIAGLIQEGVDVNGVRDRDIAILYWAVEDYYVDATKMLLENGADPNTVPVEKSTETALFATAKSLSFGSDAYDLGLISRSRAVAELLLEHGADVNHSTKIGDTPLHKAAFRGRADLCELFIEHGAHVNASDVIGNTPLQNAAKEGYWEAARVLLENGADPNAPNQLGETPMSLAKERSEEALNAEIRAENIDYNPGSDYDRTVEILLEYGAE
jgi:ankyrin repeat protein